MNEELLEKIEELLEHYTENVSVNYWVPAIPEDKYIKLAEDLVKLLPIHLVDSRRELLSDEPSDEFKQGYKVGWREGYQEGNSD